MKKLILILTLFPMLIFAQVKENKSGIKMITEYGSKNQELADILYFERIDYYKTQFTGADVKGKNYSLIVKEIWDGKIKEIDTIVNTSKDKYLKPIQSDTLSFSVTAKKISPEKLKVYFRLPHFRNERIYEATDSDDYSMRDVGTEINIETGKAFYAFAYILPYEKDGYKYWCDVESSGKDIESWGTEFGIKHYLLFEIKFE